MSRSDVHGRAISFTTAATSLVAILTLGGCTTETTVESVGQAMERAVAPVIDRDFPDPDVLFQDGRYYAYATNNESVNVQVAVSDNFTDWTVSTVDALPDLPSWARTGDTWAPEVTQVGDSFVLYFTAADALAGRQCIGVATADRPEGPFSSPDPEPLICPVDAGGAIDASTFRTPDDQLFLLWKNDGNCCELPTDIHLTPLSPDGLAIAGDGRVLITNDLPWEGDVIEAPTLIEHDGRLHLFYSAGFYGDDSYAIGHATAETLDGPWEKDAAPLVSSDSTDYQIVGPGGQDVVSSPDGTDHLVLHGWDDVLSKRSMYILPLGWDGDQPIVTVTPRKNG